MHRNLQKLSHFLAKIGIRRHGLIALGAILLTLPFSVFFSVYYDSYAGLSLAILPLLFVLLIDSRILLGMVLGVCASEFIPISDHKISAFVAVIGLLIGAVVGFLIDIASTIRRRLKKGIDSESSSEYRNANTAPSG